MSRLAQLDDLTSSETASFQKICRKLLKMTFIVREKNEEHRKDFNFIKKYQPVFSEYFRIIGYDVMCDPESGVAQLVNLASAGEDGSIQSNRKKLRLSESIVLAALWLKYEEAMVNGSLTRSIIISKAELDYQLEKVGAKNKIDKTSMREILKLFESYNLIEVIGEVGEPDCQIRLYTSMQFSLSESQFRDLAETTAQRMREKSRNAPQDGYSVDEDGQEGDDNDDE
ncbi:MAG: DUF4194 domain-containing protein [Oscillospiraceae bacterium]|nr:DUF4194 domain-containing protein [Oscillospiraceae bacterium]